MTGHHKQQALEDDLQALWQCEVANAAGYRPEAKVRGAPSPLRTAGRFLGGVIFLTSLLLFVLISTRPSPAPGGSQNSTSPPPSTAAGIVETPSPTHINESAGPTESGVETASPLPEPSPLPTLRLGAFIDGIPISVDGSPVLRGNVLRDAIASGSDSSPVLAGGWLQAYIPTRFCPYQRPDAALDRCLSFGLFDQPYRGSVIWISRGDPGLFTSDLEGVNRAAVLELRTHDARCTPDFEGCEQWPILSGVVWISASAVVPPGPTSTPPPSSVTRAQAVAQALAEGPAGASVRFVSVELETQAVPEEWPLEHDPWVWAVLLETGNGKTKLILLDYVTGDFIESVALTP